MSHRPRWPLVALAVLAVWVVAVLFWASRPLSDDVPTGVIDGTATTVTVECPAPWSSSSSPTGPLPALPEGESFTREPCTEAHDQAQILLVVDLVAAAAAMVVLIWVWRRSPAPSPA